MKLWWEKEYFNQNGSAGESDKRQRNELLHSFISLYLSVQSTKEIKTGNGDLCGWSNGIGCAPLYLILSYENFKCAHEQLWAIRMGLTDL